MRGSTIVTVLRSAAPAARPHLLRRAGVVVASVCALAAAGAWSIARRVSATAPKAGTTVVEGIYPTAGKLPANLLRLYIVFSAPMSIGESHTRLRLVDDAGRDVERPFLQLEEELWDPTRRRLTVLLDPGRVKRGLRAHLESGAPLVEGRRYQLVVDRGWRDGDGRPLRASAVKGFDVVAPDRTAPNVAAWALDPPRPSSRDALVVRFPEPLDRALLAHVLAVRDGAGAVVRGHIDVGQDERAWSFVPDQPWVPGDYRLHVASELEDVAGNSLRRVFDRDRSATGARERGRAAENHVRVFTVPARVVAQP